MRIAITFTTMTTGTYETETAGFRSRCKQYYRFSWINSNLVFSGYGWFYECGPRDSLVFFYSLRILFRVRFTFTNRFPLLLSFQSHSIRDGWKLCLFMRLCLVVFVFCIQSSFCVCVCPWVLFRVSLALCRYISSKWHWYKVWWLSPLCHRDIASGQWNGIEKPILW